MVRAIESFGATGDLVFKKDGTMTASSDILNSPSGEFKTADIGKTIVVNGAGASGIPLMTTIASRRSATEVTLASAASTTVSTPPAIYYYGTDNWAAFQNAIDETVAAGGGRITLGSFGYLVVDDLILPGRVIADQQVVVVEFVGEVGPVRSNWNNAGAIGSADDVELPIVGQTIVQKAKTAIGSKIIDVDWVTPISGAPSGIQVLFQNIVFRVPPNVNVTGLDLQHVYSCRIFDVTVEPSDHQSNLPAPVLGNIGIRLPRIGNGAQVVAHRVGIAGFDTGLRHSEHADLGRHLALPEQVRLDSRTWQSRFEIWPD